MRAILGVLAVFVATTAVAIEAKTGSVESPLSVLGQSDKRECEAFGETYLRLAEWRDVGAEQSTAVKRGIEFLNSLGRTGSNHGGMNYKPAVTNFAEFVYANPKLTRGTVFLYGLSSCAISKKAPDDASFEEAMDALDQSVGRCQVKFGAESQVSELGACVVNPVNARLQKWGKAASP